jgi:O-antigen/teichoic acid export membrane protein
LKDLILRKGMWVLGSNVARALTRLVSVAVLARLLTPADYGIYGAAFIILSFGFSVSDMGVGPSLIQLPELDHRHISTGYTISLGIGLVLSVILFVTAEAMSDVLNVPESAAILRLFALVVPLKSLTTVTESLLKRDLRVETLAMIDYGSFLFGSVLVAIALAYLGFGYWALAIGFLAGHVAKTTYLLAKSDHVIRLGYHANSARALVSKGIGFTVAKLFNHVALRGDSFIISRYVGAGALGIYNRAYRIMDLSNALVGRTLDALLFPVFSRHQGDRGLLRRAHRRSTLMSGLVFMPLGVSLSLVSREVVLTVLGSQWVEVIPVLTVLALGVFFRIGHKFYGAINRALGHVIAVSIYQFVNAVVVVYGAYLVQAEHGILGVAYVVLGALVLQYLLQSISAAVALQERVVEYLRIHGPGLAVAALNFTLSLPVLAGLRAVGGPLVVVCGYGLYLALFFFAILQLPERFVGEDLYQLRRELGGRLRSAVGRSNG